MADLNLKDIDAEIQRRAAASQGSAPAQPQPDATPSSMSVDDVNATLQQNGMQPLPAGTQLPQSQTATPQVTQMGRFHTVQSGPQDAESYNRFSQGLRDPLDAGAQLLTKLLPSGAVNAVNGATQYVNDLPIIGPVTKALGMTPATNADINQGITTREKAYQDTRGENAGKFDGYRLLGNITANAPLAYNLPGAAAKTIGGTMLAGGTAGAASGALTPVTNADQDFWQQKLNQIGLGALLGGLTSGVVKGGQKLLSPTVSPDVQLLMSKGVTPTPLQILGPSAATFENKISSLPVIGPLIEGAQRRAIGQFNTAAYNQALNPIGQQATSAVGREGVQNVKTALSDAYDNLLPNLHWQADGQFGSDLQNIISNAQGLQPVERNQFAQFWQDRVANRLNNGQLDGDAFKNLENALTLKIKRLRSDPSSDKQDLADQFSDLQSAFREGLARSNPAQADALQAINTGYANYARVRQAASSLGAADGVFTPAQLQNAVKAGDKSAGKGQFATGNALMQDLSEAGKNVLGNKYPDSGTAGRSLTAAGLGLVAGGGLAHVSPWAALTAALGASAYTPAGQKIIAALLAGQRSQAATQLAAILGKANPAISQATVAGLLSPALGSQP